MEIEKDKQKLKKIEDDRKKQILSKIERNK